MTVVFIIVTEPFTKPDWRKKKKLWELEREIQHVKLSSKKFPTVHWLVWYPAAGFSLFSVDVSHANTSETELAQFKSTLWGWVWGGQRQTENSLKPSWTKSFCVFFGSRLQRRFESQKSQPSGQVVIVSLVLINNFIFLLFGWKSLPRDPLKCLSLGPVMDGELANLSAVAGIHKEFFTFAENTD